MTVKVGVIGAMDVEVEALRDALDDVRVTTCANRDFFEGVIGSTPAVVVQCSVGMVNAAVCAQVLIGRFGVTHVVNTGVAGSLDAAIDIGDVVVATDAVNHLMDVCNLGYAPGQTPGLDALAFPCDVRLRERLANAVRATCRVGVHEGRVASGDRFVRDAAEKARIRTTFGAACCEMEGAAIAQACWLGGVPCGIVRAISDKADGSDAVDYPVFEARAAADCAAIVRRLLESWE
ncbi:MULTISPECIES: 5'-methylthioadenosine/adenosylhomocysteine nucleosidase [unclassified Adlercreutzia]|uniref:5'-methylthioadenosine/adenosylhomocysteine nucleosidase n=1 Tax=unclassified Adlercreutzia TaxID=2636013 RepID=UPI0013ED9943|nr:MULTISPECIES: 5'-methylthioadenosine/adenosylhomocysteine nucleosidase [unclassified Adlercreutzia]